MLATGNTRPMKGDVASVEASEFVVATAVESWGLTALTWTVPSLPGIGLTMIEGSLASEAIAGQFSVVVATSGENLVSSGAGVMSPGATVLLP